MRSKRESMSVVRPCQIAPNWQIRLLRHLRETLGPTNRSIKMTSFFYSPIWSDLYINDELSSAWNSESLKQDQCLAFCQSTLLTSTSSYKPVHPSSIHDEKLLLHLARRPWHPIPGCHGRFLHLKGSHKGLVLDNDEFWQIFDESPWADHHHAIAAWNNLKEVRQRQTWLRYESDGRSTSFDPSDNDVLEMNFDGDVIYPWSESFFFSSFNL